MEKFYLDASNTTFVTNEMELADWESPTFAQVCELVKTSFFQELEEQKDNMMSQIEIQKRAMIGYQNEVAYLKEKIWKILKKENIEKASIPPWYTDLVDGIYHENWGMAGLAQWFGEEYNQSSSAKLIGDQIYFMEHGVMVLKPQRMKKLRREQLVRTLLLLTPEQRLDQEFHEVYLLDGTRVTIFRGGMTKSNQDVVVFRRYVVPRYRFEEQAQRGTIPWEAIGLFESMVELGFNVVFTGAVRSAKTTFLSTWQSYEDPTLEGVLVETDPEIPLHRLMPDAPIIQFLAEGERLDSIVKNLLRSDADYVIFAEARDGQAMDAAVRIAAKGTKRMKMTFHTRTPTDFPLDAALEIAKYRTVPLDLMMKKVASSFDYVFHFIQLKDKRQKRLNSIHQMEWNVQTNEVEMKPICLYDHGRDDWHFFKSISAQKRTYGLEENPEVYDRFEKKLQLLATVSIENAEREGGEQTRA